jgi:hypothetical protein
MHASVGPGGAGYLYRASEHGRKRALERLLHRGDSRLKLPAVIRSPIVFDLHAVAHPDPPGQRKRAGRLAQALGDQAAHLAAAYLF